MKDFKDINTYIFDFDGTLVDSVPYLERTDRIILGKYNISVPENIMDIVIPLGLKGCADYFVNEMGAKADVESILKDFNELLTICYRDEICLKDRVKENVIRLKNSGKHLNVLTASPIRWVEPCMKRCGILELFDNVWSCEDFNTTKANPEIYKMAAKKLGLNIEDCAFFDDNIGSVSAGVKSGMFTVGVYDDTSKNMIKEIQEVSNKYVFTFDEI